MEFLNQLLPIIIYFLLSILLVVVIIFVIKAIKLLKSVNVLLEDIENKSQKLNGAFDLVDQITNSISKASDKAVKYISTTIKNFFKKRKKEEDINE